MSPAHIAPTRHPLTETMMISNRGLPPEILDHIVDLLRYRQRSPSLNPFCFYRVLERCCLVSKSWIPRTRRHLFAVFSFRAINDLKKWNEMFPDPSNSPGCYTRTLNVCCSEVVAAADAGEGGW